MAIGTSCAAAATLVLASAPAYGAGGGSATAKAAYGSAVTISPSVPSGSGMLGSTVTSVLQSLVDTLTSTIDSTLSTAIISLLNLSGDTADTNGGATSYPRGATLGATRPGVLSLAINGPSGSVTADASGYSATSTFSHSTLSVLGISVADLGVATATATCPTSGSPSASIALNGVSLFSGAVQAKVANGSGRLQVSLNGGAYQSINGLSSTLTQVPGTSVSVRANGNFLQVAVTISLDTLLGALGLSTLLSGLSGLVDTSGTALTLAITIGPGSSSDSSGATAWGLEVGADLSGTVSVNMLSVLGGLLGGATITIPSGISGTSYGNLLDLKLAYAACTPGSGGATTKWIPPGVI